MNPADELREFACIWEHLQDWGLSEHHHDEVVLTAVWQGENPTPGELAALRRLCPEFRDVPVGQLKARLQNTGEIELGRFSSMQARVLEERAAHLQVPFEVRSLGQSFVSYWPVARDGSGFLIIEDEELNRRVTQRMRELGVPVVQIIESD